MADKSWSFLILAGDGIGPEVMGEAERVLNKIAADENVTLNVNHDLIGGAAIDAHGAPLTDNCLAHARAADAVLLGAVGGPKWDGLPNAQRPERGLLKIRKELNLFANLRPAICFEALADASSLKTELVSGLDILIVRELTGGMYFGEPRGIETLPDGSRRGVNTHLYSTEEIRRIAKVGFELAKLRGGRVCSVDKANVMEAGQLWRDEVVKLHASDYADVELSHMYVDNCAMQLVRNPKQFDVILTDNLFGDILSDEASMLTGSLGLLPSASVSGLSGGANALYEPVHGSAPDIAGQNLANPIAAILSLAMALRYSFGEDQPAARIEKAVRDVLAQGYRTGDIMQDGMTKLGTREMGDKVLAALEF